MRKLPYAQADADGFVPDKALPKPNLADLGQDAQDAIATAVGGGIAYGRKYGGGYFALTFPYVDVNQSAVTAGRLNLLRFVPDEDFTSVVAAFVLTSTVGSAGDAVEIAVYNEDLSTRLATSGQVTGKLSTAARNTVPLAYSFTAGTVYRIGIIVPGGSTAVFNNVQPTGGQTAFGDIAGAANRPVVFNAVGNAVAPASLSAPSAQSLANAVPALWLGAA